MVGHEDPGVHLDTVFLSPLAQPVSIGLEIGLIRETRLPVVTTLNHMDRQTGRTATSLSRHARPATKHTPANLTAAATLELAPQIS